MPTVLVVVVPLLSMIANLAFVAAQVTAGGDVNDVAVWGPSGAAAMTAAVVVYVVRKIGAGELVHRHPVDAETKLVEVASDLAELVREGHKREDDYRSFIRRRLGDPGDG